MVTAALFPRIIPYASSLKSRKTVANDSVIRFVTAARLVGWPPEPWGRVSSASVSGRPSPERPGPFISLSQ